MVDQLREAGWASDDRIAEALQTVPRHLAGPDVTVEQAYDPWSTALVELDDLGRAVSSVSSAQVQAMQLTQAGVEPGMRVLEVGSGGVNAAYLAHLVGRGGAVTSIDIDARVTDRARDFLAATDVHGVEVVTGDAHHGWPAGAPYDRIIATVEVVDLPRAWVEQLTPNGRIVAPLRLFGSDRSVQLRRDGDHLLGTDLRFCGFVPMRGKGADAQQDLVLAVGESEVTLRADPPGRGLPAGLDELAISHAVADSASVTSVMTSHELAPGMTLEWVQLWLQTHLAGPLVLHCPTPGILLHHPGLPSPAALGADSLAHFSVRELGPGRYGLGATGYGPQAGRLAQQICDQIDAWWPRRDQHPSLKLTAPSATGASDLPHVQERTNSTIEVIW